ncbi:glycoside hydrolase family 2 TIM barrel-domain containing protein [Flavicella sediminum]|uniref:glycoside hydrolase family 2 TIM barrel-domain containing protein n=1 Tax=Flavicella sediminum TaxID=2585141 RepID=UPI001FB6A151|nr:glycoside hydrolase family 2 TIM barrel-domain containing protein [Flavicella sediminum]
MMKNILSCFLVCMVLLGCVEKKVTAQIVDTTTEDFNKNWSFFLAKDDLELDKMAHPSFKMVNLPHDWAVENEFDKNLGEDAKATGYLAAEGVGCYRKIFSKEWKADELVFLHFDGVYNNAEIWVNKQKLGFHPYGYSPFYFEISKYLHKNGENNEVFVKVDRTRYADSRWYTGGGIYRNVQLITKKKVHIPMWGTFVTTPKVSKTEAEVKVETLIQNDFKTSEEVKIVTKLLDKNGHEIVAFSENLILEAGGKKKINQSFLLKEPNLWSVDSPNLYQAEISIFKNASLLKSEKTSFGIRSIKFDAEKGFFLNGENMKIKGVCLHHDAGLVGAAVPKGVWRRRLQILKDGGCNAVRISHNPGSTEFLDLCDEMGVLVQDELFDEWDNPKDKRYNQNERSVDYITRGYGEHFQDWAHKDLTATILSHRNHPSIIQWSIGNEIEWTYPRNAAATGFFNNMDWNGNYFWSEPPHSVEEIKEKLRTLPKEKYDIGQTAQKLSKWVKELDTTRYVTANCILPSSSHLSGYADALDVIGYSYRRVLYDYGHKNYPEKPIMGTENLAQYHEWKAVEERDFISGTFLWTGFDYMGEIRDPWPVRVQPSGMLTTAGFKKGSYYMMKSLWTEKPHIHIATQNIEKSLNKLNYKGIIVAKNPEKWKHALWKWQDVNEHWNYKNQELISVEIYSNCEEIELFLNNKSLGKKYLLDFKDHIYKWAVPFQEGKLVAKGLKAGVEIEEHIVTARTSTQISMTVDKNVLKADTYDVAHVVVQLKDEKGNPVKTDDKEIVYTVKGPVKLLGIDNGWEKSVQKFQSNINTTHNGKTLLILQALDQKGNVEVIATSKGIEQGSIHLKIE